MKLLVIALIISFIYGDVVYVSTSSGADLPGCGVLGNPCETLAYAANQSSSPRELHLEAGVYVETRWINVEENESLTIIGSSQSDVQLTKSSNDPFVLFTVNAQNTTLIIVNVSFILTNHTNDANYIRSVNVNDNVTITFISCSFTMETEDNVTEIFGYSFYINNGLAKLGFDSCTVYNITAAGFIYAVDINALWMRDTSFVNVQNLATTINNGSGGCFYLTLALNITLLHCKFINCYSNGNGGVGYIAGLNRSGSVIEGCLFSNNTARNTGGVFHIESWFNSNITLTLDNTTCVDCTAAGDFGGALYLYGNFWGSLHTVLSECSFIRCQTLGENGRGGVLYVSLLGTATIMRCTFLDCTSVHGGAVHVNYNGNLTVTDSVFIGDSARDGSDLSVENTSDLSVDKSSYSDAPNALYCGGNSNCSGELQTKAEYDQHTCQTGWRAGTQVNGVCPMPCAAYGSGCVKPNLCPDEYFAVSGVCLPQCSFWVPYDIVETTIDDDTNTTTTTILGSSCSSLCAIDNSSLGTPLCSSDCDAREADKTAQFPCGSYNCYYDTQTEQCGQVCPQDAHYAGNTSNGVCVLKECPDRQLNTTAEYPCGSTDCFYDASAPLVRQCVTACTAGNIRTGKVVDGACELTDCTSRLPDAGSAYPCGSSDCFYINTTTATSPAQCLENCDPTHYAVDAVNGLCTLKDCSLRMLSDTADQPCGPGECYYDGSAPPILGRQCIQDCVANGYRTGEVSADGSECILTPCSDRVQDTLLGYPCGGDCFYDEASATLDGKGRECVDACEADSFHTGDVINGVCVLKPCSHRTVNLTAAYPCGDLACKLDPTAPPPVQPGQDVSQCILVCPPDSLILSGKSEEGVCLLKPCPDRIRNSSTIYPCGSADCYYDPTAAHIPGQQCGLVCAATYEPVDGECVPQKDDNDTNSSSRDIDTSKSSNKLSVGVLVAIILGAVALLVAIIIAIVVIVVVVQRRQQDGYEAVPEDSPEKGDESVQ